MADVKFETVRVAASTATAGNTQDITISGFGTPKAVMFFVTQATADDTTTANAAIGIGSTDGTREWLLCVVSKDAQTTSETNMRQTNGGCVGVANEFGTAWDWQFGFNSFITDGVRLDIDTQASAGYLITAVFIGGTDVANVYANYHDDLTNGTGTVAITAPGFTPDVIFCVNGDRSTLNSGTSNGPLSFGAAINDGSQTQRSSIIFGDDNLTTTSVSEYISNAYLAGANTSTALKYGTTLNSFDASGFTVQSSASPGRAIIFYLVIEFTGSPDLALFDMSWPTSGNYAETNPGFQPDFGMICSVVGPASRNAIDTTNGVSFSIAAFDANNIYTNNYTDDDGVTTSVAKSLSSDQLRFLQTSGSSDSVVASFDGFDSSGWDFTLSTNPGSAVLGWGFAFGDGVGGGATEVLPGSGSISVTGSAPTVTASDNKSVSPGAGSVAITGHAPTVAVSDHQTVAPGAGTVSLTGYAISVAVSDHQEVAPGAGSVVVTGYAPTIQVGDNQEVAPGAGSVTLTGHAPTVSIPFAAEVPAGSVSYTGYAPSVGVGGNIEVAPGVGSVAYTGFAPTIPAPFAVTVPTGSLSVTGFVPTAGASDSVEVQPGAGAVTVTGYAPSVSVSDHQNVAPGAGAVTVTGYAPTVAVTDHQVIAPGLGTVSVSGFAPDALASNDQYFTPPAGVVSFTGYAPTFGAAVPIVGELTGTITIYPLMSGSVEITPLLTGSITFH